MSQTTQRFRTPCSQSWDEDWIKRVNATECGLGRAVCGARTPKGTPCTLPPNHENGRCQYHGGFPGSGAQTQNRNARIHGLYARGLQQCGSHCPLFKHCPAASKDVEKIPLDNRPACPFEATQFQAALTDAEDRVNRLPHGDPLHHHLAPQVALLEVMVMRAASALAVQPLVPETDSDTPQPTKTNPALAAFLRLSSEYRRYLALLDNPAPAERALQAALDHTRRQQHDTELTPEAQQELQHHEEAAPPELQQQQASLQVVQQAVHRLKNELDRLPPPIDDPDNAQIPFYQDPEYAPALQEEIKKLETRAMLLRQNIEALERAQGPPVEPPRP